jgi:hypothetical protein
LTRSTKSTRARGPLVGVRGRAPRRCHVGVAGTGSGEPPAAVISLAGVGFTLQAVVLSGSRRVRKRGERRVGWRCKHDRSWPEVTAASTASSPDFGRLRNRGRSSSSGALSSGAEAAARQKHAGAAGSSGGALWRALRRQWRTAELGFAGELTRRRNGDESKGGKAEAHLGGTRRPGEVTGAQGCGGSTAHSGVSEG